MSIGILFKFLNKSKMYYLMIFFIGMIGLMLTHIYTWTVFVIVISAFLIVVLRMGIWPRRNLLLLLLVMGLSIAADISKSVVMDQSIGIEHDFRIITEFGVQTKSLAETWNTLIYTFQRYLGGLFANPIVLLLGVIWVVQCDYRKPMNLLLFIFPLAGTIPLLFGDWMLQARIYYIIPFQLPACMVLSAIAYRNVIWMVNHKDTEKIDSQTETFQMTFPLRILLIVLIVCIWLVAISRKIFANFVPHA
jgi:hypothetical protein